MVDPSGELGFWPADLYHEIDKRTRGWNGTSAGPTAHTVASPSLSQSHTVRIRVAHTKDHATIACAGFVTNTHASTPYGDAVIFFLGRLAKCFFRGASPLRVPDDITYMSCASFGGERRNKIHNRRNRHKVPMRTWLGFFFHWRESTASYRPALIGHRTSKRSTFFRSPSRTQPGRISDTRRHKGRRCAISLADRG